MKAQGAKSDDSCEDGGIEAPKKTTVTRMAIPRCPSPVTVGTFEACHWVGGGGGMPLGGEGLGMPIAEPYKPYMPCNRPRILVMGKCTLKTQYKYEGMSLATFSNPRPDRLAFGKGGCGRT